MSKDKEKEKKDPIMETILGMGLKPDADIFHVTAVDGQITILTNGGVRLKRKVGDKTPHGLTSVQLTGAVPEAKKILGKAKPAVEPVKEVTI